MARSNEKLMLGKVRYAVVGLGHIAQVAVLPAFAHARDNSTLVALISADATKLRRLGHTYSIANLLSYDDYDRFLASGEVDCVYLALPNHLHREYAERAAQAHVHVLCEKPMAVTEADCEAMIRAANRHDIKLMIAYRLHFEEANLKALELVQSRQLGEPRYFSAHFSLQVAPGNIRLRKELGGGPLLDLGIYCINAARNLFQHDPIEVFGYTTNDGDPRFEEVEEMVGGILRFPREILATFVCSFGAADQSSYQIVGTKGDLRVESAFTYHGQIKHVLTIDGKSQERLFSGRDQFAAELLYFSDCILRDREPEPSGVEGMADVRIIEALYRSSNTGKRVRLDSFNGDAWPTVSQAIRRPRVFNPETVHVQSPRGE